jgi:glycosyltransferase involved in cell wall biosynthesis
MARRLPVLAVDRGGPAEIVANGLTGALRSPDPAEFAAVLLRWIDQPERAAALGEAGRARAEQFFSQERFARDFAAQARSLLASAEAKNA